MTGKSDGKPKVARWAKVLAVLTIMLALWHLLWGTLSGVAGILAPSIYGQVACVNWLQFPLYVAAGMWIWPLGPGHWKWIVLFLTAAALVNLVVISLGMSNGEDGSAFAAIGAVTLVGGLLILLGVLLQKRPIEQGS